VFVIHAIDAETCRTSIVEFLQQEADQHMRSAKARTTQREKACDNARKNAILNAMYMIRNAMLADLTKPLSEHEVKGE
jgi:hypothetical protein